MSMREARTALAVCAATLWLGCAADAAITIKKRPAPPISAAAPLETKPSKVELYLNVPLAKIAAVANSYAFEMRNSGSSLGMRYDVTLIPDMLKLEASGDEQYQLVLRGNFRFAGTASQRPMKGDGTAAVKINLKIGPDWCPIVEMARPEITWASVDAPFLVRIAIDSGLINGVIASELVKATQCDPLKLQLSTLWQQTTFPILAGSKKGLARNALFLNFSPQKIAIYDLGVARDRLKAAIVIGAEVTLGRQAAKKRKLELPNPTLGPDNKDLEEDVRAIVRGSLQLRPQ